MPICLLRVYKSMVKKTTHKLDLLKGWTPLCICCFQLKQGKEKRRKKGKSWEKVLKNNAHERNERKIFRALFHGLLCPWFGLAQSFVVRAQFEKVCILEFHHICDVISDGLCGFIVKYVVRNQKWISWKYYLKSQSLLLDQIKFVSKNIDYLFPYSFIISYS